MQPDLQGQHPVPVLGQSTRLVAGEPLAANNLKCQMKPVSPADYKVSFTPDEMTALKRVFPGGVCDWSRQGVDFHGVVTGKSLGPAPSEGMTGRFTD